MRPSSVRFVDKARKRGKRAPGSVKCAQSTNKCFNSEADKMGGSEECDSDGENCEATCIAGHAYDINAMKCIDTRSDEKNCGKLGNVCGVPAHGKNAQCLFSKCTYSCDFGYIKTGKKCKDILGKKNDDEDLSEGLPLVPKAESAGLPVVPQAAGASSTPGLPVVPKAGGGTTNGGAFTSSWSSSSWSSSEGGVPSGLDGGIRKAAVKTDTPVPAKTTKAASPLSAEVSKANSATTTAKPPATSSLLTASSPSKVATTSLTSADSERTEVSRPTNNTSSKAASSTKSTSSDITSTPISPDMPTTPTTPNTATTGSEGDVAAAAATKAQEEFTVISGETSSTSGDASPVATPTDTASSSDGRQKLDINQEESDVQEEGDKSATTTDTTHGQTADQAQESQANKAEQIEDSNTFSEGSENTGSGATKTMTDSNSKAKTGDTSLDGSDQDAADGADNTTGETTMKDDNAGSKHSDNNDTYNSDDSQMSGLAAASQGDFTAESTWASGLDGATGSITSKEKVAIGTGCAAVAVFAIFIALAFFHRDKVAGVLGKWTKAISDRKRRSRSSLKSNDSDWSFGGGGPQRLSSGENPRRESLVDAEKMDEKKPSSALATTPSSPPRRAMTGVGSGIYKAGNGGSAHQVSSGSQDAAQRNSPSQTRRLQNKVGDIRVHKDGTTEEVGFDWLELSEAGRTTTGAGGTDEGRSIRTATTLRSQPPLPSRFSSSPRKRSFLSNLSSPGIIARAFKVNVGNGRGGGKNHTADEDAEAGLCNVDDESLTEQNIYNATSPPGILSTSPPGQLAANSQNSNYITAGTTPKTPGSAPSQAKYMEGGGVLRSATPRTPRVEMQTPEHRSSYTAQVVHYAAGPSPSPPRSGRSVSPPRAATAASPQYYTTVDRASSQGYAIPSPVNRAHQHHLGRTPQDPFRSSPSPPPQSEVGSIEYLSPQSHTSHISAPSLALPGGSTPPMTPLSAHGSSNTSRRRVHSPVPSDPFDDERQIRTEGSNRGKQSSEQTVYDFGAAHRGDSTMDDFPQDEEADEQEEHTGGSVSNSGTDSWYTHTELPNLFAAVPITQEEQELSSSREGHSSKSTKLGVRFA